MADLKRVVIITGATSGIGLASARLLHAHGYSLVLASRNKKRLEEISRELGSDVIVVPTDVTKYPEVGQMVQKTIEKFGHIDVLINNAGVGFFDKVVSGKIDHWHRMVDVNVTGVLNCVHASLPHLISANGHMIQIASVAAHNVFVNSGVYCATKHAVHAISESLRLELSGRIRVSTISPGAVNTKFLDSTDNEEMLTEYREYFASGLDAEMIASQVLMCLEHKERAVISEIIIRPNRPVKK